MLQRYSVMMYSRKAYLAYAHSDRVWHGIYTCLDVAAVYSEGFCPKILAQS